MKKAKFLLATAAVATAITCAVGCTACNNGGTTDKPDNEDIAAVYQLYTASAQANGETALTYEQWLESIKGPQGATGATGATGKSAYDIAKENGFEGTEEEWLASLKGANGSAGAAGASGSNGAAGKSAYDIAKDNGFTGTEAEWLESLKGVGVEGVYETSEGTVVKYTDGTVKPIAAEGENGKAEYSLLQVGDNYVEVLSGSANKKNFNFFVLSGGKYEIRVSAKTAYQYNYFSVVVGNGNISEGHGSYQVRNNTPVAGQWEDETNYYAKQIEIMAGYVHTFTVINGDATTNNCRISIVKVEEE